MTEVSGQPVGPKTSVTTNLCCVTFQKSKDHMPFIYFALFIYLFVPTNVLFRDAALGQARVE